MPFLYNSQQSSVFSFRIRLVLGAVVALVGVMAGCATNPASSAGEPQRAEVLRENLQNAIDRGDPERAIERIGQLRAKEMLASAELDELYAQAREELAALYREARIRKDYREAERRLRSLHALGGDTEPPGFEQLYLSWALELEAQGNTVSALHMFTRITDYSFLSSELIQRFIGHARDLNDREALRTITAASGASSAAVDPALLEGPLRAPQDAIPGTVTIWVNRGIRMESGAGVPDRVIGSGFFIDPRGYLITNYHVIQSEVDPEYEGYSRLFVRLPGSPDTRIPASVVGYDRLFDIALLKVEIDPPHVFSFTDIRKLEPGTEVLAIGSPGGLDNSITSGIISATGRRFLQVGDALQVDVPINPGNSGGPLLNGAGELVGVVFAGVPQFQGVNFAIASFWLGQLVPQLYDGGEIAHSWLGVALREAADGLAVTYVAPNSPAGRIGLQRDDVITSVAGTRVSTLAEAQDVLLNLAPKTLIRLRYRRGDGLQVRNVHLDERPFSPIEYALEYQDPDQVFAPLFGMEINDVSTLPWQREYVVSNVYPGSVADETGLSPQDPFSLHKWQVDYDRRIALAQIIIRKRKAGFIESGVQLASYLEQDNFL